MRHYIIAAVVIILAGVALFPDRSMAAPDDGLSITPVRRELSVDPGKNARGEIIIGNPSEQSITVQLEARTFSVTDFQYDYRFHEGGRSDWITFRDSSISLAPGESRKVAYDIAVPQSATPGGYYFSLFASTTVDVAGAPNTVQAVSLVYLTVGGDLVRTSVMQNASIPFFVFGGEVPYSFDVKNTGNIHFGAYFYGQVESLLFGKYPESGTNHLLMPGTTRGIEGSVQMPLLPGIYRVEYGYKVDFANIVTTQTSFIVYAPPWSFVALLFVVLLLKWLWQLYIRRSAAL